MSINDQRRQEVGTQYNIVVQTNGQTLKKTLKNIHTNHKWGILDSVATVEFTLDSDHVITYKRDEPNVIMLYVDGRRLLRRNVFNPVERIDFAFEIEGIECQFLCQFLLLGVDVRVRIAGHEIL